jgi:hypothetical protein
MSTDAINSARASLLDYLSEGSSTQSELLSGTTTLAAKCYVKENDADKDGVLQSDEVTLSEEAFNKLDTDSDGALTSTEVVASLSGQESAVYTALANGNVKLFQYQAISKFLKVL